MGCGSTSVFEAGNGKFPGKLHIANLSKLTPRGPKNSTNWAQSATNQCNWWKPSVLNPPFDKFDDDEMYSLYTFMYFTASFGSIAIKSLEYFGDSNWHGSSSYTDIYLGYNTVSCSIGGTSLYIWNALAQGLWTSSVTLEIILSTTSGSKTLYARPAIRYSSSVIDLPLEPATASLIKTPAYSTTPLCSEPNFSYAYRSTYTLTVYDDGTFTLT